MTAMLVETFEVSEVDADGQAECEPEALELIEKLGLEGQRKLLTKKDDGRTERMPYRKMTNDERLVYSAICPQVTTLQKFADSAIPVRVLQVAAHAVDLFQDVKVWSAKSADIKDPVLVGHNCVDHTDEYYILARWGEMLEPFEKLAILAVQKVRAARKSALSKVIAECEAKVAAVDHMDDTAILNEATAPYLADYGRRVGSL